MNQIYLGNTLINDAFLGTDRMDDIFRTNAAIQVEYLVVAGGGSGGNFSSGTSQRGVSCDRR